MNDGPLQHRHGLATICIQYLCIQILACTNFFLKRRDIKTFYQTGRIDFTSRSHIGLGSHYHNAH